MNCSTCGIEIKNGETCYQIRLGEWDEENYDFIPDEDEGYYCVGCLPAEREIVIADLLAALELARIELDFVATELMERGAEQQAKNARERATDCLEVIRKARGDSC